MSDVPSATPDMSVGDDRFLDRLASAADMVGARRFREAEVEVLRALSISPSDLRALKLLGLVRFKLGRLEEARAVCREIAATLPRDAGIRLNLGLIALKMDRLDESVLELETAARLTPDDLRAWSYLGFAYTRRGEPARAAAAFRRAGQDALAAEAEASGARAEDAVRGLTEVPTRVGDEGNNPKVGHGVEEGAGEPPPASRHDGGGGAAVGFASAFDLSATGDARVPGTDPDRAAPASQPGALGAPGALGTLGTPGTPAGIPVDGAALPAAPLVGYVVSRLGPSTDEAAWVGSTARLAIGDELFVRADAAVACTGSTACDLARRRVRGRSTLEPLGGDERPFFRVRGRGHVFVGAPAGRLVPLQLADDILYLREDRVLAFEGGVSWEAGAIPRGGHRMLQFRGRGLVAMVVEGEPAAVKVSPERPAFVASAHLLGWMGRVVARAGGGLTVAAAASSLFPFGIICEGEGVVLIDVKGQGRS